MALADDVVKALGPQAGGQGSPLRELGIDSRVEQAGLALASTTAARRGPAGRRHGRASRMQIPITDRTVTEAPAAVKPPHWQP
jgi:hypothetical protein